MIEVGRVCTKIAGREAGKKCVIIEVHDSSLVTVAGEMKTRKCNIKHLEPSREVVNVNGTEASELKSLFSALGFAEFETKSRPATIRPKKERVSKSNKPVKKVKVVAEEKPKVTKKVVKKVEKIPVEETKTENN